MAAVGGTDGSEVDSWYGWLIVAVAVLALFFMWGMLFTFTVYSRALVTTFDLSRVAASTVFSIGVLSFFLFGGGVGLLTAQLPVRRVVLGAFALVLTSVVIFQTATSYTGLAVAFGGLGAGYGTFFVAVVALVPQWFDRREGLAMGVTVSANGCGVFVMPLVWLGLIDVLGFRVGFSLVGGIVAMLFGVAVIVFRRPDRPDDSEPASTGFDLTWLTGFLSRRRTWYGFFGTGLVFNWYFVLSDQLVDMLVAVDVEIGVAAAAFGLIGGVAVVSNVTSGAIADYVTPSVTFIGAGVLVTVALILLLFRGNTVVMYLAIVFLGAGHGGVTALYPPIALRAFGTSHAHGVTGVLIIPQGLFGFVSPPLAAILAAAVGYDLVLAGLAGLTVLGTVSFWRGTMGRGV